MAERTSENEEDGCPFVTVFQTPPRTTVEQTEAALRAAHKVTEDAGYDAVQVAVGDTKDPFEARLFQGLWKDAERAATLAGWAPREGEPQPTSIGVYVD